MRDIFILEGEWHDDPSEGANVLEMFRFLKSLKGTDFFYRRTCTPGEVDYYLSRPELYEKYELVYLGFHGEPRKLWTSNQEGSVITLDQLSTYQPFFRDKVLHFGSCQTLNLSDIDLQKAKKLLGVRYLSGYRKDVDWLDSMLLDIVYFNLWQEYERGGGNIKRYIWNHYHDLAERLGFVMI